MNALLKLLLAMLLAVMAASCGGRRDDGMGDLWRGVKYTEERR